MEVDYKNTTIVWEEQMYAPKLSNAMISEHFLHNFQGIYNSNLALTLKFLASNIKLKDFKMILLLTAELGNFYNSLSLFISTSLTAPPFICL